MLIFLFCLKIRYLPIKNTNKWVFGHELCLCSNSSWVHRTREGALHKLGIEQKIHNRKLHSNIIMHSDAMICTHSDVITHCDITMDVLSNIITQDYCDFKLGVSSIIIISCHNEWPLYHMSGHYDVIWVAIMMLYWVAIMMSYEWPFWCHTDWSPPTWLISSQRPHICISNKSRL